MSNLNGNSSRTVNTKRNILFGFIQIIVSQGLPFIVRTILIYQFGVEYLGLNSLFSSILSVLSLMELGFGTAVVFSLYKPVAENDTEQICAYLTYYRKIYRVIGISILVAGLVLMPFLDKLIKESAVPGDLNLHICYLIFLSDTVISYLLFGYMTAIPIAYQRRDILSKIDMGICVLQCIVRSMLLLMSSNFYLYLLSMPVITIVKNLFVARIVRGRYPELICRGTLENEQKKELRKKVYGLLIGKITGVSRNSIDTLCISAFIGLAVTGVYNNYYFVMTGVIAFSTIVLNAMMASVGNSIAVESREKNYDEMRLFDFIYSSIAGVATVCMLCLFQPFIHTWLGDNMMLDLSAVIGLCIYFYILKSGDIRWVYQEGAGLWYECRFIMLGEAAANIVLNILLCRIWGVFGIILATVISVFITNVFFCPRVLFKQYFQNDKLKEHWKDHILYGITMLVSAGVSWIVCEGLLPIREAGMMWNILSLAGRLIICTGLSVAVFWVIWHKSKLYGIAIRWMRDVIRAN